jgi:hypothetical protein
MALTALQLIHPSDLLNTPRLYEQDGADDPLVTIHLFGPAGDWWLYEISDDASEGFGFTCLSSMPDGAELGYIPVAELQQMVQENFIAKRDLRYLIERDGHWTPKPLSEVRAEVRARY